MRTPQNTPSARPELRSEISCVLLDKNGVHSVESHFYVGPFFEMNGINEADLAIVERENHGLQSNAFTEKAHSAEKISVCNASTRKNHLFPRREVGRVVNSFCVFDTHLLEALRVLGLG